MRTDLTHEIPPCRSHESRDRILDAALSEFSARGLAGARMDQIANAAGVNKALLYYYFESKEQLYTAALEMVSEQVRENMMAVFELRASAGERLLRAALHHFDRILVQGKFQNLMQQEMMRIRLGEEGELSVLVRRVFGPLHASFESMIREGISSHELVDVDWLQLVMAGLGANVFYFLSAPVWRKVLPFEPFDLEALRHRRIALVEFLGQAAFVDRRHGAELAARVLADSPMPKSTKFKTFEGKSL